jgi:fructose 1,6-bisphosphatase
MQKVTVSAIKADVGDYVGPTMPEVADRLSDRWEPISEVVGEREPA